MFTILIVWLSLEAGLSRYASNIALKSVALILNLLFELVSSSLKSQFDITVTFTGSSFTFSRDLRTACKHLDIEPDILRTGICPKCFRTIDSTAFDKCTWKASPRSAQCNAELFSKRLDVDGEKIPNLFYYKQSFASWIQFFLSRPDIEEMLTKTHAHMPQGPNMHNLHDSPAWAELRDFLKTKYNLVFGIFMDWFNPFTNKIAGNQYSAGLLILYCMNLPAPMCYAPENTFSFTITPGPSEPDVLTINHILQSFVTSFLEWQDPGQTVCTPFHPDGAPVETRIGIPLICDLPALHKLLGCLNHQATCFCSFCMLLRNEIESLSSASWKLRTGNEFRIQAHDWKQTETVTGRENKAKTTGVRWTELQRLDPKHWDPIKHHILGFMHAFLEGVLKYQLRLFWGIGRPEEADKKNKKKGDVVEDIEELEEESPEDIEAYLTEEEDAREDENGSEREYASDSSDPTWQSMFEDQDDGTLPKIEMKAFSDQELMAIRDCISSISLPTWISRPPRNLGQKKHGKLTAMDFLNLFTIILPLILPELWRKKATDINKHLLQSFYDLVAATNIISSYTTSVEEADTFSNHYIGYRTSLPHLYENFHSFPNHHYAMHFPALLKHWGPLASLCEFAGERMNGMLQRIKTNGHRGEMELTMLTKMNRRLRLRVLLGQDFEEDDPSRALAELLQPETSSDIGGIPPIFTSEAVADDLSTASPLDDNLYNQLLHYLKTHDDASYCHFMAFPHGPHKLVLPNGAHRLKNIHLDGMTYSCQSSHNGNSAIRFYDPDSDMEHRTEKMGFIHTILALPLKNIPRHFIVVNTYRPLLENELQRTPYPQRPRFMTTIVDSRPSDNFVLIEASHIISHLSTYERPVDTYGIPKPLLVICWAMNRGRK